MKKVALLLATWVVLLFATTMTALCQTKFIVDPGVVELYSQTVGLEPPHQILDPTLIIGSVTLRASDYGSDVETAKTGGGCLIYHCTNDAQCTISMGIVEVHGYCAYTVNITHLSFMSVAKKGCWYKPKVESCIRSPKDPLPL